MRNGQLDRIIGHYAVLRATTRSGPLPVWEIHEYAQTTLGEKFCERTTRRILDALERLGMAERIIIYNAMTGEKERCWQLISKMAFFEAADLLSGRRAG